jgi:hypothetical protein
VGGLLAGFEPVTTDRVDGVVCFATVVFGCTVSFDFALVVLVVFDLRGVEERAVEAAIGWASGSVGRSTGVLCSSSTCLSGFVLGRSVTAPGLSAILGVSVFVLDISEDLENWLLPVDLRGGLPVSAVDEVVLMAGSGVVDASLARCLEGLVSPLGS